jgi:hypothetical protein
VMGVILALAFHILGAVIWVGGMFAGGSTSLLGRLLEQFGRHLELRLLSQELQCQKRAAFGLTGAGADA